MLTSMTQIRFLFILFCLVHLVRGTANDSTSSNCPERDGAARSIWSILESCALTLLICIWHAVHLDIPGFGDDGRLFFERVPWIFLTAFFAPEGVVSSATRQWCEAHRQVKDFRIQGYEWSMTHSHFMQMGGFVYDDGKLPDSRPETMASYEFLRRCEKGEIVNPLFTEAEINALSKSDTLGKAIFTFQLFWFTLQVIVRGAEGLAITLVELDTVCMSALALLYLLFWWDKPHHPQYPHIFFGTQEAKVYSKKELSKAWKSEPSYLHELINRLICARKARPTTDEEKPSSADEDPDRPKPSKLTVMLEEMNPLNVQIRSLYLTWIILGGLHLIAWNWHFPTDAEKIMWRVASLILVTSPLAFAIVPWLDRFAGISDLATYLLITIGVISRALLVGLMLASLRALPCSAYQPVDWTSYIPHI